MRFGPLPAFECLVGPCRQRKGKQLRTITSAQAPPSAAASAPTPPGQTQRRAAAGKLRIDQATAEWHTEGNQIKPNIHQAKNKKVNESTNNGYVPITAFICASLSIYGHCVPARDILLIVLLLCRCICGHYCRYPSYSSFIYTMSLRQRSTVPSSSNDDDGPPSPSTSIDATSPPPSAKSTRHRHRRSRDCHSPLYHVIQASTITGLLIVGSIVAFIVYTTWPWHGNKIHYTMDLCACA